MSNISNKAVNNLILIVHEYLNPGNNFMNMHCACWKYYALMPMVCTVRALYEFNLNLKIEVNPEHVNTGELP